MSGCLCALAKDKQKPKTKNQKEKEHNMNITINDTMKIADLVKAHNEEMQKLIALHKEKINALKQAERELKEFNENVYRPEAAKLDDWLAKSKEELKALKAAKRPAKAKKMKVELVKNDTVTIEVAKSNAPVEAPAEGEVVAQA